MGDSCREGCEERGRHPVIRGQHQPLQPTNLHPPLTCRDLVTAIWGRMRSVSSVTTPRRPTDTPRARNRWGLEVGVTVSVVPLAVISVRDRT